MTATTDIWPSRAIHMSKAARLPQRHVEAIRDVMRSIGQLYNEDPYSPQKGYTVITLARFGTDVISGKQLLIRVARDDRNGRCEEFGYRTNCADLRIDIFPYDKASGLGNHDTPVGPDIATDQLEEIVEKLRYALR